MPITQDARPVAEPTRPARLEDETILPLPARLLTALAIDFASVADFGTVGTPLPGERTSTRVHLCATHDIWLIRWAEGSRTALHDHGGSAGALYVVAGELLERRPGSARRGPRQFPLGTSAHRAMSSAHVHEVANESSSEASSVHVYSPPLSVMHHYETTGRSRLRRTNHELIDAFVPALDARLDLDAGTTPG